MSKYRSVDVGNTLFGKVKLDPCCIACDRPFGPAAQARRTGKNDSHAIFSWWTDDFVRQNMFPVNVHEGNQEK